MIKLHNISNQYAKPIKPALAMAFIATSLLFQGCAVHTQGYAAGQAAMPESPPGIIRGQPAKFYGEGTSVKFDALIMQNWRDTGLFSSVDFTSNKTIPITGTYIKTYCYSSTQAQGGDHGLIGAVLRGGIFLLTAGMIDPIWSTKKVNCDTTVYQNGVIVGASSTTHSYKLGNGMLIWLTSNEKGVISETEELTAHAIVSHVVADMDKRTNK